jgi:hypothetical protein
MNKPELECAKQEILVPAAKAGGIAEVRIIETDTENVFVVCVEISRTGRRLYLAARREPNEPRQFKSIDVAIKVIAKLVAAKKFTVLLKT